MGYWSDLRNWLLKDPAKLIRYLVLFVCCIIVIVQLYECFSKLRKPPVSTHAYYYLNETIEMPAVTICRDPPYKAEVLSQISGRDCMHPRYSSCWSNYPYEEVSLSEFFINSTFTKNETFFGDQYGLGGCAENIDFTESIHFYMGRCHTLRPKVLSKRVNRNAGYSFVLSHHVDPANCSYGDFESEPGWHIFIHDQRENFTEILMKGSGRVEYVFAEINEEIEIKLQTQYFSNIETSQQSCSSTEGYSDLKCGTDCIMRQLSNKSNCTGPWMHDVPDPPCSSYKAINELTSEYSRIYNSEDDTNCDCIQPCQSRLFTTYIQNRKSFNQPEPNTQIYIYYTNKLLSMIEERLSYDSTQFIADVGGSLGFLLGLSVLGIIGILEHLTLFLCGGFIKKMQAKDEKRQKMEVDQQSQQSDETVDIATIVVDKSKVQKSISS